MISKEQQAAAKVRARGNGQTLVELVATQLAGLDPPASAAEITTTLATAHPGRNIVATVVRSTLENRVSKGRAERSRQRRAVFYSLLTAGAGTSVEAPDPALRDPAVSTESQDTA
ncbi:hypothetical protein [Streptomyces violascens]|uniref:hypothetical protein n=1 Tax=Streptomyces violascens TaxID=67381 RepID=UPI003653389B